MAYDVAADFLGAKAAEDAFRCCVRIAPIAHEHHELANEFGGVLGQDKAFGFSEEFGNQRIKVLLSQSFQRGVVAVERLLANASLAAQLGNGELG